MDKFQTDFAEWLYNNYEAKNMYDLILIMQHKYLSKLLDVQDKPLPLSVGSKAHEHKMDKVRAEVFAMARYYNANPDIVDELRVEP